VRLPDVDAQAAWLDQEAVTGGEVDAPGDAPDDAAA
jgi:hypothetical protein